MDLRESKYQWLLDLTNRRIVEDLFYPEWAKKWYWALVAVVETGNVPGAVYEDQTDAKQLSPLAFAFLGFCVGIEAALYHDEETRGAPYGLYID